MKSIVYVALALITIGALANSASAADNNVSGSTLNAVGLPGFNAISDTQGMNVRGKFAAVGGFSLATSPGAISANGYVASGHTSASGGSLSLAVSGVGTNYGFVVVGSIAGGAATAHAH